MSMFKSEITELEVAGNKLKFYPLSIGQVFRAKSFMKTIGRAIASFSQNPKQDQAQRNIKEEDLVDKDGNVVPNSGGFLNEDGAIAPELAKVRTEERRKAAEEVVDALMGDDDGTVLASFIHDTLRKDEKFIGEYPKASDIIADNEITVVIMTEMLKGLFASNKETFAPLRGVVDMLISKMTAFTKPNSSESEEPQKGEVKLKIVPKAE